MKMFGKLTRDSYDWHPDKILCKRFNIANPYPQSTLVGVPGKIRKDKFDSFDFFGNQETQSKPDSNRDVTEGQQQEETGKNRFEPVLYKQIHNLVKRV